LPIIKACLWISWGYNGAYLTLKFWDNYTIPDSTFEMRFAQAIKGKKLNKRGLFGDYQLGNRGCHSEKGGLTAMGW
jgi:hypothetical protein